MGASGSPLDPHLEQIAAWAASGLTNTDIVRELSKIGVETTRDSVRRAKKRAGAIVSGVNPDTSKPGISIEGNTATINGPWAKLKDRKQISPDELKELHGLNPSEWIETKSVASWWGSPKDPSYQLKIWLEKKPKLILQAAAPESSKGKVFPKPSGRVDRSKPILIPVMPDMHCPLEEPTLCDGFAAFLKQYRKRIPRIVYLGDGDDASSFGRHSKNPKYDRPAQEGVDGYYHRLRQGREACPDAEMVVLPGNHDWWIHRRVLENVPGLYGLKQAGTDTELLHPRHLLRLNELQIDFIDPRGGEYHEATYTVPECGDLVLMHGNATGPYGGAVKEIAGWDGTSTGQGHDHKLAMVAITRRRPDGTEVQHYALSFGTASTRSLGYDPRKNVNQGFGVIVVWPDGRWHPEFAHYDPQRDDVTWRDFRYLG